MTMHQDLSRTQSTQKIFSEGKQTRNMPCPDTAVILAAGAGTRMRTGGRDEPKPLVRLLGLSLLERSMRVLRDMGVRHFIIVTGHEADRIAAHAHDIARRNGLNVTIVQAENWQKGNGASALAAEQAVPADRPFFLTMADHVLSAGMKKKLCAHPLPENSVRLAVDRDRSALFDPEDATKVSLAEDLAEDRAPSREVRIRRLDKALADWDAVDSGLFLCSHALFSALRRAAQAGRHGLSDAMNILAEEGRLFAADVTGEFWMDADTPEALKEAERRLLAMERGKGHDGPVSRYINRPLSRLLTSYLVHYRWITPNRITLASFLLALLAAWILAQPGWLMLALGGLLAQAASIIDGVDGEIARLRHEQSDFGGWLDAVLDRYADGALLFALAWHAASASAASAQASWLWGFLAIIGSFVNSYTADKYDGFMRRKLGETAQQRFRLGRDVRIFLIMLGALFNLPLLVLAVIAIVMNAEVARRIWLLYRADN